MNINDSELIDPINSEPGAGDTQVEPETHADDEQIKSEVSSKPGKFSVFSSIQSIAMYAILLATLFTLFSPNNLFSGEMIKRMFEAARVNPTYVAPVSTTVADANVKRIGIVVGHWKSDSGALCDNGLTEVEVNLSIGTLVQKMLTAEGFQVDLLEEADARLPHYKGIALISIHADTCDFISDDATGFKVSAAMFNMYPEKGSRLTSCMVDRYSTRTQMTYHPSVTNDMTYYHAFDEIDPETTAAIIETGFLNLDQQILTKNPELIAQGIVDGMLCFIRNENIHPTPTPAITATMTP